MQSCKTEQQARAKNEKQKKKIAKIINCDQITILCNSHVISCRNNNNNNKYNIYSGDESFELPASLIRCKTLTQTPRNRKGESVLLNLCKINLWHAYINTSISTFMCVCKFIISTFNCCKPILACGMQHKVPTLRN